MSIERLKTMKDNFMCAVEGQMYNLAEVDAEELGEVVDMIKDLSEAIYYCEVVKAMEESKEKEKNGNGNGHQQEMMYYTSPMYYPMYYNGGGSQMYYNGSGGQGGGGNQGGGGGNSNQYADRSGNTDGRDMPRMYYNGGGSSGGGNSGGGGRSGGGNSGGSSGGNSQYSEREFPMAFQDGREGRSPRSRRMYMEAKETHQDKATQMRELEKYMQELAQDVTEMIEGASQEERQYLSKKISSLAQKVTSNP